MYDLDKKENIEMGVVNGRHDEEPAANAMSVECT